MPNLLCTVTKITVNWVPPPRKGGILPPHRVSHVISYLWIVPTRCIAERLKIFFSIDFCGTNA